MKHRPIVIDENFTTDDITTLEGCDEAESILDEQIATIKLQLEQPYQYDDDPSWTHKANRALMLKKVGLVIVQRKRSALKRMYRESLDQRFISIIRTEHPDLFNKIRERVMTSVQ